MGPTMSICLNPLLPNLQAEVLSTSKCNSNILSYLSGDYCNHTVLKTLQKALMIAHRPDKRSHGGHLDRQGKKMQLDWWD